MASFASFPSIKQKRADSKTVSRETGHCFNPQINIILKVCSIFCFFCTI
uniref:Uncharacterized protein n=1 Tax=Siphoviridae sp. cteHV32 TaxID=2825588 RepID=A0A8S5QH11_9CAUD|nr:MAG TPA: hypothetical protein [Siphoviridae sp. cteHV32]